MTKINLDISEPLPEGSKPVESTLVMRCVDPSGVSTLVVRSSPGLTAWDSVGMLTVAADRARGEAQQDFISYD